MTFELYEISRIQKGPKWIEIMRTFAQRQQDEVKPIFHDMTIGEFRKVAPGIEIARIA